MPKSTVKTKAKKPFKKRPVKASTLESVSSTDRLETLLEETERELEKLQPEIDKLEKQIDKLKDLKLTKQKLITLRLSVKSILSNFNSEDKSGNATGVNLSDSAAFSASKLNKINLNTSQASIDTSKTFLPDEAFAQVDHILKKKSSLNYELFRGIVFNGGRASTEQLKQYLVDNGITQPGSGKGFENMELTDISSRANYLIRKGIAQSDGRGVFVSLLGWREED